MLNAKRLTTGSLCGSEFVNQEFVNWVIRHAEFQENCVAWAISETAMKKYASHAFDATKHDFSTVSQHVTPILIVGPRGRNWTVEVSQ